MEKGEKYVGEEKCHKRRVMNNYIQKGKIGLPNAQCQMKEGRDLNCTDDFDTWKLKRNKTIVEGV